MRGVCEGEGRCACEGCVREMCTCEGPCPHHYLLTHVHGVLTLFLSEVLLRVFSY